MAAEGLNQPKPEVASGLTAACVKRALHCTGESPAAQVNWTLRTSPQKAVVGLET